MSGFAASTDAASVVAAYLHDVKDNNPAKNTKLKK